MTTDLKVRPVVHCCKSLDLSNGLSPIVLVYLCVCIQMSSAPGPPDSAGSPYNTVGPHQPPPPEENPYDEVNFHIHFSTCSEHEDILCMYRTKLMWSIMSISQSIAF